MPGLHSVMQLRLCATPSIVTRHSKQIPIPQRGPRGSPRTDRRKRVSPAASTAAATVVPDRTETGRPFTRT
jgi:hypothetical protein